MRTSPLPLVIVLIQLLVAPSGFAQDRDVPAPSVRLRIATWNIEDVSTDDLIDPDNPRLLAIAREILTLRPEIILLNEIAYDWPSDSSNVGGRNGQRFVDTYLTSTEPESVRYRAFMPQSNTGLASGFDLDHDGMAVTTVPHGSTDAVAARAYGNDSWGFGTYPGQYAFAILVSDRFEIEEDSIRTFRRFKWSTLPDALVPMDPDSGSPWYPDSVWLEFPLSSKTHLDVPVRIAPNATLHVLASHPTPPAFDGPEGRNRARNHDEIRFWNYFLSDADFVVDDRGQRGGLARSARFVIMGDLNADPDEGNSVNDPVGTFLLRHPRVGGAFVPLADRLVDGLDPDDTARWGLRVDYVLPSAGIRVVDGAVARGAPDGSTPASDHFAVWLDIEVPIDSPQ